MDSLLLEIAAERAELNNRKADLHARLHAVDERLHDLEVVEKFLKDKAPKAASAPEDADTFSKYVFMTSSHDAMSKRRVRIGAEKRKVYEALRDSPVPLTPQEIAEFRGLIPSTVRGAVRDGVARGDLHQEDGKYRLTEVGLRLLADVIKAEYKLKQSELQQDTQLLHVVSGAS